MKLYNSTSEDIGEIFRLYTSATEYQKVLFPENTWPKFERQLVATEVKEKRQFKIVIDAEIACVWAVTYTDPQIWETRDEDTAIYLHRIATSPDFRGRNFVHDITKWAIAYAKLHQRKYVRMDTCGHNQKLIKHYKNCGFIFLGKVKLNGTDELPAHYQNADVCHFEIEL